MGDDRRRGVLVSFEILPEHRVAPVDLDLFDDWPVELRELPA